jgi:hypothetical protein
MAYGVSLWKNIRRGWERFCSHTKFEVGDGSKVRLCHDLWCRDTSLKEAFLVSSVVTHLEFSGCPIQ